MSRINHQHAWETEEHPSLEVLRQYQSGELPAPQSHEVEKHLVSCEMCSDLLGGMAIAQPARVQRAVRETRGRLKDLLAQKKRKRKMFQWPVWQTAAVLLVLLFAIAEVVYHHYFNKPASHMSEQTAPASWNLKGKVVNSSGEAIPGASVLLQEKNAKTLTDATGSFYLEGTGKEALLEVTHAAYTTKQVRVQVSDELLLITLTRKK